MLGMPYVALMPGFVRNELGGNNAGIAFLLASQAAGGLAASLIVAGLADSPRAMAVYSGAGLLFGVSLIATAAAPTLWVAAGGMFVSGLGSGGFQTLNGAVVIRESDPRYFGRVMSLTMSGFAMFGLAALPLGFLADQVGERVTLAGMGVAISAIVVVFTVLLSRLSRAETRRPAMAEAAG
jgi:predicted MFS family arabinose efflux permease